MNRVLEIIDGDRLPAGVLQDDRWMIHQVLTDAFGVDYRLNSFCAQMITRSDARQHQELGGIDRAAAQDHLLRRIGLQPLAAPVELDPFGANAIEQNAPGQNIGHEREILAAQRRAKMRHRRAAAPAVSLGRVKSCDAFGVVAVQIL